jgi:hypothetical protein
MTATTTADLRTADMRACHSWCARALYALGFWLIGVGCGVAYAETSTTSSSTTSSSSSEWTTFKARLESAPVGVSLVWMHEAALDDGVTLLSPSAVECILLLVFVAVLINEIVRTCVRELTKDFSSALSDARKDISTLSVACEAMRTKLDAVDVVQKDDPLATWHDDALTALVKTTNGKWPSAKMIRTLAGLERAVDTTALDSSFVLSSFSSYDCFVEDYRAMLVYAIHATASQQVPVVYVLLRSAEHLRALAAMRAVLFEHVPATSPAHKNVRVLSAFADDLPSEEGGLVLTYRAVSPLNSVVIRKMCPGRE